MAMFRVGQRVRKVRMSGMSKANPIVPVGTCGVVIAVGVIGYNTGEPWDYGIRYDHYGDKMFFADAPQIEPIQPERNQTVAWSECLWQPTKETA